MCCSKEFHKTDWKAGGHKQACIKKSATVDDRKVQAAVSPVAHEKASHLLCQERHDLAHNPGETEDYVIVILPSSWIQDVETDPMGKVSR
jgi:hypothetical protein